MVERIDFESKILKGNPLKNPTKRKLIVYLPPEYDKKRKDPYPVIFLLSGFYGRGIRFLNEDSLFSPTLPDRFDQMIRKNELPPFIVVMPDGSTKFGGSQYVNSETNGRFMDYICDELIPYVDTHFHTHRNKEVRGVMGHSSGGFGAMALSMIRPDSFRYFCSSAGDSWYEWIYVQPIPMMVKEIDQAKGVSKFLQKYFESPNPLALTSHTQNETLMNLAMCAAYAPNPKVDTLMGDLYFDLHTGELIPEIWKKFLNWDPVFMVDRYKDALKKMKWIHLEAGLEDEYALHIGHRQISRKLKKYGIPHELTEYPGKHGGHNYRYGMRIKKMLAKMPI